MHTLSSASRTCMASASAVECTATVWMPSSLQARSTRSAISPRLAIRILSNIGASFDDHQRLAELDRLAVLDQNLGDRSAPRGRNLVHGLHRLDDEQRVAGAHALAIALELDFGEAGLVEKPRQLADEVVIDRGLPHGAGGRRRRFCRRFCRRFLGLARHAQLLPLPMSAASPSIAS